MDAIDLRILSLLQKDGRMTNAEIARRVDRAPSAVYERIKGLEEDGVIRGYTARIDPKAVGAGLLAFVAVRSSEVGPEEGAAEALMAAPEAIDSVTSTRTTIVLRTDKETPTVSLEGMDGQP